MGKISQFVAVLMVAAVLSGAQCVELCAFHSAARESKTTKVIKPEMPCHQQHAPKENSELPRGGEQCSHHELVAEKRSKVSPSDDLQTVSLLAVGVEAHIDPVILTSPFTTADVQFPRSSPSTLTSILRI